MHSVQGSIKEKRFRFRSTFSDDKEIFLFALTIAQLLSQIILRRRQLDGQCQLPTS